jgi:hypothetical protein
MRAKLTIGAVAVGLALSACGSAAGPASGAHPRSHAGALSARHVRQSGLTVSDVKDLAQMKREYAAALLSAADRTQCG